MFTLLMQVIGAVVLISTAVFILMTLLIAVYGVRRDNFSSFKEMSSFLRGMQQHKGSEYLRRLEKARALSYRISLGSFAAAVLLIVVGLLAMAVR